ncbi:Glycerol-3-phosphate dehydrogenase [NAD(+)], partial [Gryllus bimaculatus]
MYVYEEMINGKKLSDIINEEHENVKYLPGYIIPSNVVAVPDIVVAAKDADALIFVVPHQFVRTICANLLGKIKPTACALSLVKNVVALGAGLIDGLKVGLNTKATMIRMGMLEIIKFVDLFYPGGRLSTFFESCGIADYISTCITGRNRRVAEAFARSGRDLQSLQEELLKGEPLQGAITASVVHTMLAYRELEHRFPLITTIHLICQGSLSAPDLLEAMKTHTETSGSVVAIMIGENAQRHAHIHDSVNWYVREEMVNGRKLSEIINEEHENVNYLPGHKLPENVVAVTDIVEAVKDADALVFVIPHQFIVATCESIVGKIKPTAHALSLIKGFHAPQDGEIELVSHVISRILSIETSVLMGANLAKEIADKFFTEATLVQTSDKIIPNVVAVAAGMVQGLGYGLNTTSTVMRMGMLEMIRFVDLLYPGGKISTFFASCGVADVITSCSGGRNRNIAQMFVTARQSMKTLERTQLHGQKLQGPDTAAEVNVILKSKNLEDRGSAIAIQVCKNATRHPHLHQTVTMYVYEEIIQGKKLTDIINEEHINPKYLPGFELPDNLYAIPDVILAAKDSDAIIFVVPHQFVRKICMTLVGKIKPTALACTLSKGFEEADDGGIELISHVIQKYLRVNVSVLMGANLAFEVAKGEFTEGTLGCSNKQAAPLWTDIFQTDDFKITVTEDVIAAEVYSGLKNIVAVGAGLIDGLEYGDNTKAVMMRLGIMEMIKFIDVFYPGARLATFFESCGIADLITTCYGGRNRRMGELFAKTGKDMETLEMEHLDGQQLQGPATAA